MYISHFTKQKVSVKIILPGQLTQLVECLLDVEEVGGSSPSLSTKKHAGCPLRVFLSSPAANLRRGMYFITCHRQVHFIKRQLVLIHVFSLAQQVHFIKRQLVLIHVFSLAQQVHFIKRQLVLIYVFPLAQQVHFIKRQLVLIHVFPLAQQVHFIKRQLVLYLYDLLFL